MSKIGLIDVDGGKTFPNLALMKISAWYKSKGHCDPIYKQLSRWVNNRYVFAKCERFENYTQKKTETENDPTLWD